MGGRKNSERLNFHFARFSYGTLALHIYFYSVIISFYPPQIKKKIYFIFCGFLLVFLLKIGYIVYRLSGKQPQAISGDIKWKL